MVTLFY